LESEYLKRLFQILDILWPAYKWECKFRYVIVDQLPIVRLPWPTSRLSCKPSTTPSRNYRQQLRSKNDFDASRTAQTQLSARPYKVVMVHPLSQPPDDPDYLMSFQLLFSTTAHVIHWMPRRVHFSSCNSRGKLNVWTLIYFSPSASSSSGPKSSS
jgi:hypothetical protein